MLLATRDLECLPVDSFTRNQAGRSLIATGAAAAGEAASGCAARRGTPSELLHRTVIQCEML